MNILSLFDGISTGYLALKDAGLPITNYYASEINKYCISISKYNFPDIIHIGDIKKIDASNLPEIDMIFASFPCQSFSIAGNRKGFGDKRGNLFFDLMRIFKAVKPKYFLFENVASMKKSNRQKLDELIGVKSFVINSTLLSAQQKKRLYWCNWKVDQPKDKEIYLKDILEKEQKVMIKTDLFNIRKKSKTIRSGGRLSKDRHEWDSVYKNNHIRKLTPIECERLQTLPDNFSAKGIMNEKEVDISNTQRFKVLGNGWTKDVIVHILKYIKN